MYPPAASKSFVRNNDDPYLTCSDDNEEKKKEVEEEDNVNKQSYLSFTFPHGHFFPFRKLGLLRIIT